MQRTGRYLWKIALQNLSSSATIKYETQKKISNKTIREKHLYEKKNDWKPINKQLQSKNIT